MVDCFDRIHLKVSELTLRPLQALRDDPSLTEATISPPGRGPRVHITIRKTRPAGPDRPPTYHWSARDELGAEGQTWTDGEQHDDPDAAYWSALDTIAAARTTRATPTRHSELVDASLSDVSRRA
jgi:hypothetical protein